MGEQLSSVRCTDCGRLHEEDVDRCPRCGGFTVPYRLTLTD